MSTYDLMRTFRRLFVVCFLVACAAIVVMAVVAIASFLSNPFAGFAGKNEFTGLSGSAAKRRLDAAWPPAVDPGAVQSVSYKTQWSRDSYSSWYRVQLTEEAATKWIDYVHAETECCVDKVPRDSIHEGAEGVSRTVGGPPPLHQQTGETPAWWSPPPIDFLATEVMIWYKDYDSGVGRGTYSAFDESTGIVWIYDYAAQHDRLWSPGEVPAGTPIRRGAGSQTPETHRHART